MPKYLVTIADGPSVGMSNREVVVEAASEQRAYRHAKHLLRGDEFLRGVQEVEIPEIRFTGSRSLPMYGTSVEELYLDIDGVGYVVRVRDGEPLIERA